MSNTAPTAPRGVEFRLLTIPPTMDGSDAARDFADHVAVRNAVYREISGHDDNSLPPDELLPMYQPDDYQRRHLWLVLEEGRPIGRVGCDIPLEEGSKVSFWLIELLRETWGRGIGSAGHDLVEQTARSFGRTVLQAWAEHPDAPGRRLQPPTGFGSIPEDHGARFFLRHGHTLEQIERCSVFDLTGSFDRVDALAADARAAADGYRTVHWIAPTPEEFVSGYGWMKSRMITDAPSAGIEFDDEVWDAARVAAHDAKYTQAGRRLQVTAAQHIATGELCAFNELVIGKDRTAATQQEDTLVLSEHRGHRLGMLVKTENLRAWRDVAPASPRVITYNAEENRPMLDINEAIGFVPLTYEGAWKKVLA
ncbi:hypothetical protein CVS47_01664 [Microbacterium lemovicicum]|uniref:N-acetyltransferase domain-containing protein n=1 Tax=Microbacterium lemovicicum TaxID=1072463 RepID=A0A3Q9IY99_9MICO|nr:GNAT family N-acetyltransferase [Microbacterium lemovicicum]AZS37039.1 hypothetical protein CVS47_01664 [Microbacterium lemovicicum]